MAADPKQITPGVIIWNEIPCTDLERVQKFYSTVFGWTSSPTGNPDVASFNRESTNGSFIKLAPENLLSPATHSDPSKERLAVRITINVDSIDATLKEVEKAGGASYIDKVEVPGGMGFIAYFTDSEKNVMGLWSLK